MPLERNEILFNLDEGAYLPVLDIAHKATTAVTETRLARSAPPDMETITDIAAASIG